MVYAVEYDQTFAKMDQLSYGVIIAPLDGRKSIQQSKEHNPIVKNTTIRRVNFRILHTIN